eukprot:533874-Pelagomonas_calceolata.AAC.1
MRATDDLTRIFQRLKAGSWAPLIFVAVLEGTYQDDPRKKVEWLQLTLSAACFLMSTKLRNLSYYHFLHSSSLAQSRASYKTVQPVFPLSLLGKEEVLCRQRKLSLHQFSRTHLLKRAARPLRHKAGTEGASGDLEGC